MGKKAFEGYGFLPLLFSGKLTSLSLSFILIYSLEKLVKPLNKHSICFTRQQPTGCVPFPLASYSNRPGSRRRKKFRLSASTNQLYWQRLCHHPTTQWDTVQALVVGNALIYSFVWNCQEKILYSHTTTGQFKSPERRQHPNGQGNLFVSKSRSPIRFRSVSSWGSFDWSAY